MQNMSNAALCVKRVERSADRTPKTANVEMTIPKLESLDCYDDNFEWQVTFSLA